LKALLSKVVFFLGVDVRLGLEKSSHDACKENKVLQVLPNCISKLDLEPIDEGILDYLADVD
jgi:hypothetical protein